jgi:acetyltransferase-like isoleucine patch superfamily enzyme
VISADVMITDNDHAYGEIHQKVMNQALVVSPTTIGKYCFLGMGARIMAGTVLGDNCIVGSNAVVSGIFPGYVVLAGIPARIIKRYDFAAKQWRRTNSGGEFNDAK